MRAGRTGGGGRRLAVEQRQRVWEPALTTVIVVLGQAKFGRPPVRRVLMRSY